MTMTQEEMQNELIARASEDSEFRARLLEDPKGVIREFTGAPVPEAVTVHVHEESATSFHLVLPPTSRLSEEELAYLTAGEDPGGGAVGMGEDDDMVIP